MKKNIYTILIKNQFIQFFISTILLFIFTNIGIRISYLSSWEEPTGGSLMYIYLGDNNFCIIGLILIIITKIIYDIYFNKIKSSLSINKKIILWYFYLAVCFLYTLLCFIKIFLTFLPNSVMIIFYDLIALFILPFFNILWNILKYKENKTNKSLSI